jgi:transposase
MLPLPATLQRVSLAPFLLLVEDVDRGVGAASEPAVEHRVELAVADCWTWTIGGAGALLVEPRAVHVASVAGEEDGAAGPGRRRRGGRPGPAPVEIGPLAPWMGTRLRRLSRGHRVDAQVALRARMIRMLVRDPCVAEVAKRLGVDRKTVRLWRDRFLAHGSKGLFDEHRSGRPRRISDVARCELISMACGRPKAYGIECQQTWTFDALHAAFRERNPGIAISRTHVMRVLRNADLRQHRMQAGCIARTLTFARRRPTSARCT